MLLMPRQSQKERMVEKTQSQLLTMDENVIYCFLNSPEGEIFSSLSKFSADSTSFKGALELQNSFKRTLRKLPEKEFYNKT